MTTRQVEKRDHTLRLGVTLIELLVSIAIIAILAGLAIPGLRSVREKGQRLKCMTHIRSMGDMVQIYTLSNRDSFPTWADPSVNYNAQPERWAQYTYQIFGTFESTRWQQFTGFSSDSETMYCPANQWHPDWYQNVAAPDYVLSSSVYIDPSYLNPDIEYSVYSQRLGARTQRISTTRYPSSKAGVYELSVWHGWGGVFEPDVPVGDLSYWQSPQPGSVWFMDGHAEQIYEREGTRPINRYPIWSPMTFGTTKYGILGRDI